MGIPILRKEDHLFEFRLSVGAGIVDNCIFNLRFELFCVSSIICAIVFMYLANIEDWHPSTD